MISYPLHAPMPAAIEVEGDPLDAALALADQIEQVLGAQAFVDNEGACLIVPEPERVYLDGRTLRGEEYEPYAQAVMEAAGAFTVRTIRHKVEHMCPLAFGDFDSACWDELDAAFTKLPGWMGAGDLPHWFGKDERLGPCLWASVEPPGLHIGGILELDSHRAWLDAFESLTGGLPLRAD